MIVTAVVGSASGLHARAAARVAAIAASCPTPIWVRRADGDPVPADSVLALLTLAAPFGTALLVESASASDAALVAAALAATDRPRSSGAAGVSSSFGAAGVSSSGGVAGVSSSFDGVGGIDD